MDHTLPLLMFSLLASIAFSHFKFLLTNAANTTGAGGWADALRQANAFLASLNLTEKAGLVSGGQSSPCVGNIAGIPRLNFSGFCLQDGPNAIRIADLASVFPAGLTIAASWDRELMYARGMEMASEFRGKGAQILLGPSAGPLGRHALGGRNWEGFSPDPYLSGIAFEQSILGIQSVGVQAVAKHFIGNEQETHRTNTLTPNGTDVAALTSNIDDRTMHELYMWPFANAVRANVASVMCSYNRLNQTYACENSKLLNGYLKGELGFQGYVMSDWYATHSGVKSIGAGLDMNMPGDLSAEAATQGAMTGALGPSYFRGNLTTAVQNGSVPESRLDDMIRRIMTPYFYLGQDQDYPSVDPTSALLYGASSNMLQYFKDLIPPGLEAVDVRGNHSALIRKIGAESTVMLKNVNNTLPLKKPKVIGVFGGDAADVTIGLAPQNAALRNPTIGTLMVGGGSGTGHATYIVSPIQALRSRAEKDGSRVQYIFDEELLSANSFEGIFPFPDVCLVFLKTFASETTDRTQLEADYNSTTIVENVSNFCASTVVVTHSGGINTMPWAENPNVTAILAAHYPGQETGNSLVDVLYGDVNPSGKLPYTIPRSVNDTIPILNLTGTPQEYDADAWQVDFTEGQLIDYRRFDANSIEPLYEFGYGLSYTTFNVTGSLTITQLGNQTLSARPAPINATTPGGNPELWQPLIRATTTITNSGNFSGATVLQLYVSLPQDTTPAGTSVRALRGFEKVFLEAGASQDVSFDLMRRDISYWDVGVQDWVIPQGAISVAVGHSSRDLVQNATLSLL